MTAPKRRWFRFSLLGLFVVVTLAGAISYWAVRLAMARVREADDAFQATATGLENEQVTTRQYYDASIRLLDAELAVPFGDHPKAVANHLQRITALKKKVDVIFEIGLFGDFRERDRVKAEVDGYYSEAQRMAANTP